MKITQKYIVIALGISVGILGGYAYWYFYGCVNGCSITSSWWKTSVYGGLMGYLVFDGANDFVSKRKQVK